MRCLSGFAARVRTGCYGRGSQVQAGTVSQALTAIGKTISLAFDNNPVKEKYSSKLAPRLRQTLDGWEKEDPPTTKKLPAEVDIPELLAKVGQEPGASEREKAVGDWSLAAYFYLLRVGEYTTKKLRNRSKQTKQFKLKDIRFFKKDEFGKLRLLDRGAPDEEILSADAATLKLDNQKNGWKAVCVNQWTNGHLIYDGVRALGRRYVHVRRHATGSNAWDTYVSAFWENGTRYDISDKDMRESLKWAAEFLHYEDEKGIPVDRVDTHSLRMGGANALALAGYSDTQIQKMGRWRGATFKEYVREELACYSEGMSKAMSKKFGFVNVTAGALVDVTDTALGLDCNSTPDWESAPAA